MLRTTAVNASSSSGVVFAQVFFLLLGLGLTVTIINIKKVQHTFTHSTHPPWLGIGQLLLRSLEVEITNLNLEECHQSILL